MLLQHHESHKITYTWILYCWTIQQINFHNKIWLNLSIWVTSQVETKGSQTASEVQLKKTKTVIVKKNYTEHDSMSNPTDEPLQTLNWVNIIMTSLINHLQSVRYSLFSTSHWQCHLHTALSVFWYFFYFFFGIAGTWQPCTTCLHIPAYLIFKSTLYGHAHFLYLILCSYILFFTISFYVYFLCVCIL